MISDTFQRRGDHVDPLDAECACEWCKYLDGAELNPEYREVFDAIRAQRYG